MLLGSFTSHLIVYSLAFYTIRYQSWLHMVLYGVGCFGLLYEDMFLMSILYAMYNELKERLTKVRDFIDLLFICIIPTMPMVKFWSITYFHDIVRWLFLSLDINKLMILNTFWAVLVILNVIYAVKLV